MISVVVPLYNEESVVRECCARLKEALEKIGHEYEIILVNDGSRDKTKIIATEIAETEKNVKLINFSRNFGHQTAITAGMDKSSGDAVVVIDADLQDPPELIGKMVEKWQEGYMVVYGKRIKREKETFFKKFTAKTYYRLLKAITNVDIPVDTGDFRLIDKKVCRVLCEMKESNRYVRGLVSFAGFSQCSVEYVRQGRLAGETKYSLKKMLRLAVDGIASFSYVPLKAPFYIGSVVLFADFIYLIYKMFSGGISGVILNILTIMLSGFVLIFMGIFGEYIGRIYEECKKRPLYIIESQHGFENECQQ